MPRVSKLPFEMIDVMRKIRRHLPTAQCDPLETGNAKIHGVTVRDGAKRYDLVYDESRKEFRITAIYDRVRPTHFFESKDADSSAQELKRLFHDD